MLKRKKQVIEEPDITNVQTNEPTRRKPLRLWPGVVIVLLQWVARFGVPLIVPGAMAFGVYGELLGGLALVVWWMFFSRSPWSDRLGGIVLMIVAMVATPPFLHESIATGGQGMLFYIYAIPVLSLALVAWAVTTRHLSNLPRRTSMVATILLACGIFTLMRTGGVTSNFSSDLHWRWTPTPEERLLAQTSNEPMALPLSPVAVTVETKTDWRGFRGLDRNGIIRGVRIETDWSVSPPVELWRRAIGPGWSSFAVRGDLIYTQEQRGNNEVVACYNATTGKPVWTHYDAARFWESNGGAGPRATPTLSDSYVYAFGATGILNVLNAGDGTVVWSRNVASDTDTNIPFWGFSSSPLVVDDIVIVATAGTLVAYDLATGDPRWFGPSGGDSYSSPHLLTIDGMAQILLLSAADVISVAPTDGTLLWKYSWPGDGIVQPALTADGNILLGTGSGIGANAGTCLIDVVQGFSGWTTKELWTSVGLKPYFNDFVIHKGHAFGFDGRSLVCIDVENGKRKWKGGSYGGQLVLLADQDLLLVLSEQGELALVKATPDQFTELTRFPAIKGKTWNHPVLTGDVLLIRNGQEMAAFRLSLAGP